MSTQIIKMRIQLRRATTAEWLENKDVIPAAGEPCYDLDLKTLKIGDGITTYENLPAIGDVDVNISADGKSIVLKDDVFQLMGFDNAEVGAQPRKNSEGMIEWVIPSANENMDTILVEIDALRTDVTNLQEIVTPTGEDAAPLLTRIEALESKMDGTDDGSVDAKIDVKIEAFATSLTNDGKVNTLMELINYVESHGTEAADMASDIKTLQELVGDTSVNEQILAAVNESGHITEKKANAVFQCVKYEISHKPVGTLVDYRDKEIRIMCPADTEWKIQNVGAGGNGSQYYIGFKAYAPDCAVSFKEDLAEIISDDTMYYFEGNDFAGIDEHGRKYSICWLAVATHDADTNSWHYYGADSTIAKYLGFYYSVEWYDANGKKIDSDCIRINLSNEDCHSVIEPFYMNKVVKEVAVNGALLDVVNGRVDIAIAEQSLGVKGSDEIDVAEDGTLSIKSISFDKIVQAEDEIFVMDGGGAV